MADRELIDRDKLIKDVRETITERSDTFDWFNLINRQPIVNEIDCLSKEFISEYDKLDTISSDLMYYRTKVEDIMEKACQNLSDKEKVAFLQKVQIIAECFK